MDGNGYSVAGDVADEDDPVEVGASSGVRRMMSSRWAARRDELVGVLLADLAEGDDVAEM